MIWSELVKILNLLENQNRKFGGGGMRPDRVSDFCKLKKIRGGGQPASLSLSPGPLYYVLRDEPLMSTGHNYDNNKASFESKQ